ncbi:MAG: hypothetical protein JSS22_20230 [Proteobacteria bacterium]|nr:hypothetical protein [Pseudomonadota bacterium]
MSYEPFGERLEVEKEEQRSFASKALTRAGAGLFWVLLTVIVAARAIYFQPWSFHGLDVVAWAKSLPGVF